VASNALYFLTLLNLPIHAAVYGVIGASLVFQIGLSFYKASNAFKDAWDWNQMKRLETVAYGAMLMIFAAKVGILIGSSEESLYAAT
jgi:hypothetical protein